MRISYSTLSDSDVTCKMPVRPAPEAGDGEGTAPLTGAPRPSWRLMIPLVALVWIWAGAEVHAQQSSPESSPEEESTEAETEQADDEGDGEDDDRLTTEDMILVTAQKQEELLHEVPLSVTAFTTEALAERNITEIQEISVRTPGMHYGNFSDVKLSPLSLRGVVGSSGSAGADPAVSQYVDEVYIGQGAGAFLDLFDLERVEVLRGPQGLFFGRNSIGGAVSYTTRRPSNELEMSFEGNYGEDDYHRVGALVSGPVIKDKLAGKLSIISNERDGTFRNITLDRDVNSQGSLSARGQLLWKLGNATQLTVTAERHEVDQETLFFETLEYNEESLFVNVLDSLGLPRNEDPFDRRVYGDIEQPETLEVSGYSAHFTSSFGDTNVTSVTSYRDHDYSSRRDTDASALRWLYDGDPEQVDRFSQELRASWWTPRATYLVGAYYFDQTSNNQSFVDLGPDITSLLLGEPLTLRSGSDAEMTTTSLAGFGNVTFRLNDRTDMSLGIRYTRDEKEIDYAQDDPLGLLGGTVALQAEDDWGAATPAFTLRHRFTDGIRGYVNISRGFKSGGFNDALGSADGISFGPEFLWNYELGVKSILAGGRLTANLAAFYMDWNDIQIVTDNPRTPAFDPITANAGAATSTGLEGDLQARPSRHWRVGLNFSLLDAEYDGGTQPDGEPLGEIPYSPDYTATVSAEYRRPVGFGEWFVGGELMNRGDVFLTQNNDPDGLVDAHSLVDARLGYSSSEGGWRVTLWGKNITDETVKQRLFDLYDLSIVGQKFIALNEPAAYGVTVGFTY